MQSVIVLDGQLKGALCAARVLGRKGVEVVAGAERSTAMTLKSRYVSSTFIYPSPKLEPQKFIEAVASELANIKNKTGFRPVVYTFSDATTMQLAREFGKLKDLMIMPLSTEASLELAYDKRATAELAESLMIATMPTYDYADRQTFDYPVVVKNNRSVVWQEGVAVSGTAEFVFSVEELEKKYREIETDTDEPPLIQRFVTGDEYGVECLAQDGKVLLEFAHKRIRSLSPRGGAAVVKEAAPDTKEVSIMREYAKKLIKALAWTGPIMVEFKVDTQGDTVRLMEINGRFWGSITLPQAAGVDFIKGYYDLATTGVVQNQGDSAPRHLRTYHSLGDVKWLTSVLFVKDPMRYKLYPRRSRALWDFSIEIFKGKSDVFAIDDPMPSWWEFIDVVKR